MDQEKALRERLIIQFGTPPKDLAERIERVKALAKRKGQSLEQAADALYPKDE